MKETLTTPPERLLPNQVADLSPPATPLQTGEPTPEQRRTLIHRLQAQALNRADPLAANVGMVSGDLLSLAGLSRAAIMAHATTSLESPEDFATFAEHADIYLRILRQFDRFAQIERQLAQTPQPGPSKR